MPILLSDPTFAAQLEHAKALAAGGVAALAGCAPADIRVTDVITLTVPRRLADPTGRYHATIEVAMAQIVAFAHAPDCGRAYAMPAAPPVSATGPTAPPPAPGVAG